MGGRRRGMGRRAVVGGLGAIVLAGLVGLAGCTSSDKSAASSAGLSSGGGSAGYGAEAGPSGAASAAAGGAAAGGSAAGATADPAAASSAPLVASRALIRTAELTVQAGSAAAVPAAADRADQLATAAGGQVYTDDRTTPDSSAPPSATLTLQVPSARLTSVLTELRGLGRPLSQSSSTQDVTSQLVDVTSRVASARAAIAQLQSLYARATKVSDVITIETTLSQREADLESMEAQQQTLQAQTAMATVTLRVVAPTITTVAQPKRPHHAAGFAAGLRAGWHGFTATVRWLAHVVGAMLPFLITLGVVAGLALAVWLRLRRRRRIVPAPVAE